MGLSFCVLVVVVDGLIFLENSPVVVIPVGLVTI